ncbi:MAG: dethiobiotin synthase [Pyrinomonadaceae bacterium]|nr:dethiobiotin synthase [Pyrinomonadaceae bacterium]
MRGIFVTGTDTGIGKTVLSAALAFGLRDSENVVYWKPVQTGIEEDNDTETVRNLALCSDDEIHETGIRLEKPLSPHLSARLAGRRISIGEILKMKIDDSRFWIVEGAGGVLVPLNENELIIDLIKCLDIPVLIASRSNLGTINHTVLTIESLRGRGIDVKGVVMIGEFNAENRSAIEHYGKTDVLAEMPKFERLDSDEFRNWSRENLCRL